jgi:hypothetical protein
MAPEAAGAEVGACAAGVIGSAHDVARSDGAVFPAAGFEMRACESGSRG